MVARIRAGLSYANVVGTLALFIALGGVSYAAVKLPSHSVGAKELKTGAVTSAKVRNGTLRKKDFKQGQLPHGATGAAGADGADGLPGMNGAAGPKGEAGPPGPQGDPGPAAAGGPAGPQGEKGEKGDKGDPGTNGTSGTNGTNGTNGAKGDKGDKGDPGTNGTNGTNGINGTNGTSGVVATQKISGFISAIAPADGVWQFLGNQATVTTTAATQRLTASMMVPLATTGIPNTIKLDVCYQLSAGGAINAFSGGAFSLVAITQTRGAQAVSGTIVPGTGTWKVGACAQTSIALDNNDFVNGYVQVTN